MINERRICRICGIEKHMILDFERGKKKDCRDCRNKKAREARICLFRDSKKDYRTFKHGCVRSKISDM